MKNTINENDKNEDEWDEDDENNFTLESKTVDENINSEVKNDVTFFIKIVLNVV